MTKGFTLIELLIVLAIIGLLSSVLLPNISGAQTKAKEAAVKAIMYNLQTELEAYHLESETYPEGSAISAAELATELGLKKIPKNPFTGREFTSADKPGQILYSSTDESAGYTLTGYRKDGSTELFVLTNN